MVESVSDVFLVGMSVKLPPASQQKIILDHNFLQFI